MTLVESCNRSTNDIVTDSPTTDATRSISSSDSSYISHLDIDKIYKDMFHHLTCGEGSSSFSDEKRMFEKKMARRSSRRPTPSSSTTPTLATTPADGTKSARLSTKQTTAAAATATATSQSQQQQQRSPRQAAAPTIHRRRSIEHCGGGISIHILHGESSNGNDCTLSPTATTTTNTTESQQQQHSPRKAAPTRYTRRRSTDYCGGGGGGISPNIPKDENNKWQHRIHEILNREVEDSPTSTNTGLYNKKKSKKDLPPSAHDERQDGNIESNNESYSADIANAGKKFTKAARAAVEQAQDSSNSNRKRKSSKTGLQRRRRHSIEVSAFPLPREAAAVCIPPPPFGKAFLKKKEALNPKKSCKPPSNSTSSGSFNSLPGRPSSSSSAFDKIVHRPKESFYSDIIVNDANAKVDPSQSSNKNEVPKKMTEAVRPLPHYRRHSIEVSCPTCPFKTTAVRCQK
mmetsp:Transcript_9111/g.20583  ORF Transcript_9111/g.20583 Transcript_9111/m.20583 type:complete len:459 (-) Transcript_9111:1592-2968(-)